MPLTTTTANYGLNSSGLLTAGGNDFSGKTGVSGSQHPLVDATIGYSAIFAITSATGNFTVNLATGIASGSTTGASATGTLGLSPGNALPTETVTIGAITYTFIVSPATAYDVTIGATLDDSISNLIAAINHASGEGTLYGSGTPAHPLVTAAAGSYDTIGITAITPGPAGNSIVTTTTLSIGSWSASTLTGGTEPVTITGADGTDDLGATTTTATAIGGILITLATGSCTLSIGSTILATITSPGGIQLWSSTGDASLISTLTITATAANTAGKLTVRAQP